MRNRPPRPKKKAAPEKKRAPTFSDRVYEVVRRIPSGKVVSYGDVAALLGSPRAARGVGWALNALDGDSDVPWWRVINQRGAISIRHPDVSPRIQRALLEDEGVAFDADGCVDWSVVRWIPGSGFRIPDSRRRGAGGR